MTRKFQGDKLVMATHNAGKLEEMRALLYPLGVTILSARDLDLAEPEETEDNFVGNARIKAHAAAQATGLPALADDSGSRAWSGSVPVVACQNRIPARALR